MKFIHLLFVILFTGLFIANYYYVALGMRKGRQPLPLLQQYSLRFSFYVDIVLALGILIIPITCVLLIYLLNLSVTLPWLMAAYHLCAIVTLFWLLLVLIKFKFYRTNAQQQQPISTCWPYVMVFHLFSVFVILCLLITLHDAVFQRTFFHSSIIFKYPDDIYQWLKVIHVVSASILFGTGAGTAFYMWLVSYSRDIKLVVRVTRRVVIADWVFTLPSGLIQAMTGIAMMAVKQYHFTELWLLGSIIGYLVAGACWVPVVYLQMKCRDLAIIAERNKQPLPQQYYRLFYTWCALGIPAFSSLLVVIYLMTEKPVW